MRPTQKDLRCEILCLQKWRQTHRQKHQQKCRRFLRRDHLWCTGHDVHKRAVATALLNIVGLPQFPQSWGQGRIIGFGIVCGRHKNATGKPDARCKKQVLLGEVSAPM